MSVDSAARDPDLLHTIYQAASWARIALVAHLMVVNGMRLGQAAHPWALALLTLLVIGWSMVAFRRNQRPAQRTPAFMAADLSVTALVVGTSRLVLGPELLSDSYLGNAVYWMLAAPTIIGIWRGALVGLACAPVGIGFAPVPVLNSATSAPISARPPAIFRPAMK